jgi:hypothetical protein
VVYNSVSRDLSLEVLAVSHCKVAWRAISFLSLGALTGCGRSVAKTRRDRK